MKLLLVGKLVVAFVLKKFESLKKIMIIVIKLENKQC